MLACLDLLKFKDDTKLINRLICYMMLDKSEIFNFECLPLFGVITVSNQNILASLLSAHKFLVGC